MVVHSTKHTSCGGDKYQYKEQITVYSVKIHLRDRHMQEVHITSETASLRLNRTPPKVCKQKQIISSGTKPRFWARGFKDF